MDVTTLQALPPRQSADVLALAIRATTHDGVKPLSEQTVIDLRRLPAQGAAASATTHLILFDRPGEIDAKVLGYAHVEHPPSDGEQDADGAVASYELVVHPDHRGQGLGGGLLDEVLRRWPGARGWAHGNIEAAQQLAESTGLRSVRELWKMDRQLTRGSGEHDLPQVVLPDGFAVRSFEVGRDEAAWLEVNARAFTDHDEQGRTTLTDLQDRFAEPWFDPHGFLLVEDVSGPVPQLAAFHWTKVEPAEPGSSHSTAGEVYVVGVDPAYQGRGLGTATTLLGLRHLAACGLGEVTLYVDGDNEAAVATYHRLGFDRSTTDVMYAKSADL
ncbi:MAG: mycothiol synthase [Ornithinimicrobium sp.]